MDTAHRPYNRDPTSHPSSPIIDSSQSPVKKVSFGTDSILLFDKQESKLRSQSAPENRALYPIGEAGLCDTSLDEEQLMRLISPRDSYRPIKHAPANQHHSQQNPLEMPLEILPLRVYLKLSSPSTILISSQVPLA